jgi:hypothetical protein
MAVRACVLAAAVLLALPASASAGAVSTDYLESGSLVSYTGAPGETNDVTVGGTTGQVTINDTRARVRVETDLCEPVDVHTVRCSSDKPVDLFLGDGDDAARARPNAWLALIDGEEGDDVLRAGDHSVYFTGGPGGDQLLGGRSGDYLEGGPGRDLLVAGGGDDELNGDGPQTVATPDTIHGGSGRDKVLYAGRHAPVTIDLRGSGGFGEAGEGDVVTGVEDAIGGKAADVIVGTAGPNRLHGGGGDLIRAGGGDDDIWVNEPQAPRGEAEPHCGRGRDVLRYVSSHTLVRSSCEAVRVLGFGVATAVRAAGDSELALRVKQRSFRFHSRCRAVVELAGPYPDGADERPPRIGLGVARAPLHKPVEVRVKLTDYGRRLLAGAGRTRVLVSVDGEDSCGGPAHGLPRRGFTILL